MNAILLSTGLVGFACLPPPDAVIGPSPFNGPFVMDIHTANNRARDLPQFKLEIIRSDNPHYAEIASRCPPIFY